MEILPENQYRGYITTERWLNIGVIALIMFLIIVYFNGCVESTNPPDLDRLILLQ